jgi:8-oxo-dGTP pyrophosphatase MutT (NUDIX family)
MATMKTVKVEVSDLRPADFEPKGEAAACYLEIDHRLLLIQQGPGKIDEGLWGVPAGKLEPGETPEEAARRELFEETGIELSPSTEIICRGTLYIRHPDLDFLYHMFKVHLEDKPTVQLSSDHSGYLWTDAEDFKALPLRPGSREALRYFRQGVLPARFHFAPAQSDQRTLIHGWLAQKYIQEWIHGTGLQNTLNGLEKFFQGTSHTTYWIGYEKDLPFAFLITSPESDDAITLDLFICHPDYLGKGLAVPMIREFLFTRFPKVKRVLIDPEVANTRAIHVYKKAGFKITGEFIADWHPVPHYMMELDMENLINS